MVTPRVTLAKIDHRERGTVIERQSTDQESCSDRIGHHSGRSKKFRVYIGLQD